LTPFEQYLERWGRLAILVSFSLIYIRHEWQ
jgi:hypothetical protein